MPTPAPSDVRYDRSLLTDADLHLFNEGTHARLFERLGAHVRAADGEPGTQFAVWAPNARRVAVVGDFNQWDPDRHPLQRRGQSGIWEGFVPGVGSGVVYKYRVDSEHHGYSVNKADPFAFASELPPRTASVVATHDHAWQDETWMAERRTRQTLDAPMSIYEVHLGSWRRVPGDHNRWLSYREIAHALAGYAVETGFTHVELLPIMEHPFYGSWGYQTTGYFAPTSRYGSPEDFMYFVDVLHQHGIGVILDWVPSHFPGDEHGLVYFDGTHLFEHEDARQGFHPDWRSYIFNYGRHEVRSFLLSSAMFWLDRFHIDGLRVDAVASMLYLDYSRKAGEWIPNRHGGHENLEAIDFLRQLNTAVFGAHDDVQTMAEESTSWPMVSRPTYVGGLGFGFKWDMGWMHDTLEYMALDPIYRKHHHDRLTFRQIYAFSENFVLPLSHDEVVYGKGSLFGRMVGSETDRFANLRLLLALMYAQSGKKLIFMGGEFGQRREWNHERSLDWHLLETPGHRGVQRLVADLNRAYRVEPALHERDCDPAGFQWIDPHDHEQSAITFLRRGRAGAACLIAANFTPVPRHDYRVGVPTAGYWREMINSDALEYGGTGAGNLGGVPSESVPSHGHPHSLRLTLPPLSAVFLAAPE